MSARPDGFELSGCNVVDSSASDLYQLELVCVEVEALIARLCLDRFQRMALCRFGRLIFQRNYGEQPHDAACDDQVHISSPVSNLLHCRHNSDVSVH